jgi:hypothetical protein
MHSLLLTRENPQTRIKPLSNDSIRHIRRQNTHTAGGAGLEPAACKHVSKRVKQPVKQSGVHQCRPVPRWISCFETLDGPPT